MWAKFQLSNPCRSGVVLVSTVLVSTTCVGGAGPRRCRRTRRARPARQRASTTPDDTRRSPDSTMRHEMTLDNMRRALRSSRVTMEGWMGEDETRSSLISLIDVRDCHLLLSAGDNDGASTCGRLAHEYTVIDDVDERARRRRQTGWASSSSGSTRSFLSTWQVWV